MDADLLQTRLEREKNARKQAEALLEEKTREVYLTNEELRQAAQQLFDQTEQLNAVFDLTLAGIFLINDQLMIKRANRAALAMFGRDEQSMIDCSVLDLFQPDQRETIKDAAEQPAPGETFGEADHLYDSRGVRPDNSIFPMELAIAAVELDGIRQTVWICRDITRRQAADAKRLQLEQELSQAQKLESLGTLSSGIAHEINTPIQYVNDNTCFLKEAFDDVLELLGQYEKLISSLSNLDNFEDQVKTIRESEATADLEFLKQEIPGSLTQSLDGLKSISTIVTAIKEFAHPGTEEKTTVDINKAIETTITVTRNQWKYTAELDTDFDANLPNVPCFPGDLNQVILNLIVNAAHAIEARGTSEQGKITIQTARVDDMVEIRVGDTGCGIAEEHRSKIFDPFFTTKEVGKGTGQGLSIAYSIIASKHGGSLSFTSTLGEGTTFTIALPVETGEQSV